MSKGRSKRIRPSPKRKTPKRQKGQSGADEHSKAHHKDAFEQLLDDAIFGVDEKDSDS